MTTATNDLPARLREHAAVHEVLSASFPRKVVHHAQLAQELREAAAALERAGSRPSNPRAVHENGAERLCRILYGRGAEVGDTIGGLDAQMLHDAHDEIERMRKAVLPEED
jgi:hypothetical protein